MNAAFDWGDVAAGLGWAAVTGLIVMLGTFAIALNPDMHRVVDIAWGLAFAAVAAVTFGLSVGQGNPGRRLLVIFLPVMWAFAGTAVWAFGLFFEAVGDAQPARFEADPASQGRIMDQGPWRLTRHPNYFGDFLIWWGLFLVACNGGRQAVVVSVISPLVMSVLLIKGSGKRLLERHMAGRPGWGAYAARTSGFFPRPPRRG